MKKYLMSLAAVTLVLAACGEKEPQKSETPEISVNPTEITAVSAGTSASLQISSNTKWAISTSDAWITFEPASGEGDGSVTVTVAENTAYKAREGKLSINSTAKRVTVTVKQDAAEKPAEPVDTKITEIKSADDFAKFAASMDQYEPTETVKLAADITIEAPVDSLLCNFDGQDHTINITYEAKDAPTTDEPYFANVGVFRIVKTAVKNLKTAGSIKAVHETAGTYHIGGIAGLARNSASFENCTNGISLTLNNASNTHHAGGIAGYTEAGVSITGCRNTGKVSAEYEGACKASQIGGIIGHLEGAGNVVSCTNDGDVSYKGAGTTRMGGICGYVNNLTEVLFKDCTNNGAIDNDAAGYTASSWAYVGGLVGYYGTPTIGGHALYEGCVNNGPVTCDAAGTKLRARVAGINCHAGNSGQTPDDSGNGINTWEFKNCTNNGDIAFKNGVASTRAQIGGIQAYGEPSGTVIIDGCTSNGQISMENAQVEGKWNGLGALLGGNAAVNSRFTNNTVTDKVVLKASLESAHVGLIAGTNNPYTTAITGKVGAATIIKGETTTTVSSANFSTLLFGLTLGTGGNADGVTFAN